MLLPQHPLTHALHVERQQRIEDHARQHALAEEARLGARLRAVLTPRRSQPRPSRSQSQCPVGTGEVAP